MTAYFKAGLYRILASPPPPPPGVITVELSESLKEGFLLHDSISGSNYAVLQLQALTEEFGMRICSQQ